MKTLYILRGLPGSGKSTLAKIICEGSEEHTTICSTDIFFVKDGQYKFDPTKLGWAHQQNKNKCYEAMKSGYGCIVIDNTNIKRADFKPYLDMAAERGFSVQEIIVGKFDEESIKIYAARNTHGVPIEAIKRMAERFQL